MDEYIDRKELEIALNHRLNFLMAENGEYDHYTNVEPVKRGRWLPQIVLGTRVLDCSECKTIGNHEWKRCPACEAKMIEEVSE